MRACEESAEVVVAKKAAKAAGAKVRRTEEGSQPRDRPEPGEKSRETSLERQLRQLPGKEGKGGAVDPLMASTTRRRAGLGRGRKWKKMPEDNPGSATLEAVLAPGNLRGAWSAVKANDGAPGVDEMDMEQSERHLREHWGAIREKLQTGRYKPGAVRAAKIPKANGGERQLGIPNITDRLIQQAIHQVLSAEWEPQL